MYAFGVIAIVTGSLLLPASAPAQAQTVPAQQMRNNVTMQDLENNALHATTSQASAGAEAALGTMSRGNVFRLTQTGDYNTVTATQTGIDNIAMVTQVGLMNTATITQSGTGNRVTLRQGR